MNLRALWAFIAGDSRFAPIGVAVAVAAVVVIRQYGSGTAQLIGPIFVAILALGLMAAVGEKV